MLDKKMEELSEFIQNIEQMDPLPFLDEYGEEMLSIQKPNDAITKKIHHFNIEIDALIKEHSIDVSEDIIINQLFYHLLYMLKKHIIFKKAISLGIQPSLYKKEMRFLFKGIK